MSERVGDIGLIGLAVMGQNLILNIADHGFNVIVYNRTVEKVDNFLANEAKGKESIIGARSIQDLAAKLKKPRRVILLVKAGSAVDDFIQQLLLHFEAGDIIIDGGNSEYTDTRRRFAELKAKGIRYIGSGVSGGEEGARYGPSLMPGGDKEAWPFIKDIFQAVAAKVDGNPCCEWVGSDGAGHFVKMVHNGIEYGDMQLIGEIYHLMVAMGLNQDEMADIFADWNKGELDSFLIEITRDILRYKDEKSGEFLLPKIKDSAGQKGTGKWTAISALNYGVPVTLIGEAVFSRCLSALKNERVEASKILPGPENKFDRNKTDFIEDLKQALYASKIVSYAQGFMLMREAASQYNWDLDYGSIALMWRGGCIIRSVFLGQIKLAFEQDPKLKSLLMAPFFVDAIKKAQKGWRNVVITAVNLGVPTPALSTALAFYDGYRAEKLPANLLQAQRDYFGAHTYELLGEEGKFVHTNWTGHGGNVSASTYTA
ncbi:6-phosphogluconate dehydrogenase, decarboxylating [Onthophagus taurus]|uniref:6-phosphogluconate dehydrogenase, decarboxylating n=1 Tax=Onthophagus taurus TaxID=166361 RepID=UPI000C202540|nr:6-phosphogluconate dehydrogenase, decarboxylating [Onthophagus taurus]